MKKRYPVLSALSIIAFVAIVFSACRKINDYTELGGGLIPPIDNINTFDSSVTVEVYNNIFQLLTDSQRISKQDEHFLGLINNDPIFGKTDARIFMQLKPGGYGSFPFARKDSVKIDSVVLILNYVETYGDTNTAQTVKVYEMNQSNNFKSDSGYLVRLENFTYNTASPLNESPLGYTFLPKNLKDSVKVFRDTTVNQLRMRLDTNFARRFFNYDTTNAYKSDSLFNSLFKGFAIRSETGGNAIMGFNLNSTNTKLAFYYNYPKTGGGGRDTAVTYFFFINQSAEANYIKRDYAGTPVLSAAGSSVPASIGYIQKTPGTFANLKIPALATMSNRVVHRAELIVEQLYDPSDAMFPPPENMYIDAFDPTITTSYKYRTIPYSLELSPISGFSFNQFGVSPQNETDAGGNKIKVWKFDVSRYIQNVVNSSQTSYDLRLYAPLTIRGKTRYTNTKTDIDIFSPATYVNPSLASGRIRIVGNTGPADTNPHRIRLRIVYSRL